jgi:hypothetical protein
MFVPGGGHFLGRPEVGIFAPSDLSVVTEILRSHLGSQAASIEKSCARAQARSSNDNRSIGAGIRRIVGAWEARRPDEALQIAKELQNKFPKSGDVANILGQALLRLSPPQSRDADREFDTARRLGLLATGTHCRRNLHEDRVT